MTAVCVASLIAAAPARPAEDADKLWGLSLDEVKKEYPGGEAVQLDNGSTAYGVVVRKPGMATKLMAFVVGSTGLSSWTIIFLEPNAIIDTKTKQFEVTTLAQAEAHYDSVRRTLTDMYGTPTRDGRREVWRTKSGGALVLSMTDHGDGYATTRLVMGGPQAKQDVRGARARDKR